jgi:hypothetical protein
MRRRKETSDKVSPLDSIKTVTQSHVVLKHSPRRRARKTRKGKGAKIV